MNIYYIIANWTQEVVYTFDNQINDGLYIKELLVEVVVAAENEDLAINLTKPTNPPVWGKEDKEEMNNPVLKSWQAKFNPENSTVKLLGVASQEINEGIIATLNSNNKTAL